MTAGKRAFDLAVLVLLSAVLWPVALVIAVTILLRDGRPVFFVSERMRGVDEPFGLVKFRTMTNDPADRGVSGGDKSARITATGRFLRRYRLDEIPQLWNIARGDISFVGPRPPLRQYVEKFPDLYREVLKSRPGLTGLATLAFHRRESVLLQSCRTPAETEAVYVRRCVPVKARLDRIYSRNSSVCYDMLIMVATVTGRKAPKRSMR